MNDNNSHDNGTNGDGAANDGAANEGNGLDADERLRAADPAAGVEPRAGFAEDVIARALAAEKNDAAPVHDLSAERVRRRPRWLPWVAVAASLALVGGAGYGIGSSASPSNIAGAPISLQSGSGGGAATGGAVPEMGAFSGAVGAKADSLAMGRRSDMISPWGFGRNIFSSTGLSNQTGTAAGYTFDARAASSAETVSALGAALGVAGTPELKDGSWVLGPQDGSAPSLSVGLDAALSFYFNDPSINPWNCNVLPTDDASAKLGATDGMCAAPTNLPSEASAIDALKAVITGAGRDASAFEYTSETWEGAYTRMAQAWPVVNGQRIDQSWSIETTDAGVVSASGALADIVPLGDYAIASEQQAFERLSDPRFGAQMTAMPIALHDMATTEQFQEWVPPTEPPATPASGASVSWPVNKVDIVSARLGLASQWQPDGSVLIVPAYEFTDAAGGTWSVIAVADSQLNFDAAQ